MKLPRERAADDGVDVLDAFVPCAAEFARVGGTTVPDQIGWSGTGQHPGLEQPPGDEGRWLRLAEAQGSVEAIGDEVAEPVPPQDLQRQLRMGGQEFADARGEDETGEKGIELIRSLPRTTTAEPATWMAASSMPERCGLTCW